MKTIWEPCCYQARGLIRKTSNGGSSSDEIGFIVKHIDKKGFIHFHLLGGFDPKTLTAQRVLFKGEDVIGVMGSKPIHVMSPKKGARRPSWDFY